MKHLLSLLTVCLVLVSTSAMASFPVDGKKEVKALSTEQAAEQIKSIDSQFDFDSKITLHEGESIEKESKGITIDQELLITLLLWFFLGGLAAHRWYKKKPVGWNILFILTAGGCGIWAIVDLVNILTDNF